MTKTIKILSLFLVVVIIGNIILIIDSNRYKKRIENNTYNNILEIRQLSDNNSQLLDVVVKSGKIKNIMLLKLYRNYSKINIDILALWEQYNFYSESVVSINKHKIELEKNININENHYRIENFLNKLLDKQMENQDSEIILDDLELSKIVKMKEICDKLCESYKENIDLKFSDLDGEKRRIAVKKNDVWFNILEEIYSLEVEYSNDNF